MATWLAVVLEVLELAVLVEVVAECDRVVVGGAADRVVVEAIVSAVEVRAADAVADECDELPQPAAARASTSVTAST